MDMSFIELLQNWLQATDVFDLILKGGLIYIALFWIALIVWVTKDVIHRTNNILFQTFAILLNTLLPIFGLMLYFLIRPSKTLMDKYYDEVEMKALGAGKFCSQCGLSVHDSFDFCPDCGASLKSNCGVCKKPSFKIYKVCPFCGEKKSKKKKKTQSSSK